MLIILCLGNPGEKYKNTRHNAGFMFGDHFLDYLNKEMSTNHAFKKDKYLQAEIAELNVLKTLLPNTFKHVLNTNNDFRSSAEAPARRIDGLAKAELPSTVYRLTIVKPQTYMNRSGQTVAELMKRYKTDFRLSAEALAKAELPSTDCRLIVAHDDLDIPLGEFKLSFGKGPKIHNGVNSVEAALKTTDFHRLRIGIDGRNGDRSMPGESYVLSAFDAAEQRILLDTFHTVVTG